MIRGLSPAHDLLTVTSLFAPSTPIFLSGSLQTAKKERNLEKGGASRTEREHEESGASGNLKAPDLEENKQRDLPRLCTLITFQ